jgi:tRNA(Leu) C34 or U34 (ribose-2'-O)-methylase TrmL
VDKQFVINRSGKPCFTPAQDPEHPAELFESLDAVREACPGHKFVMVEKIPESPLLYDYEHPAENVIYVFGPDGGGIESIGREDDDWLYIPMSSSRWGMWSDMCGTLVMADRWRRGNR